MQVELEVDPADIVQRKADDRGRITIGSEYAGEEVRVAIVGVDDED